MNVAAPGGTSEGWYDVFHEQDGAEQPRQVILAGMGGIETTPIYGGLGISEGKISWHNLNVEQHVKEEVALDATAHAGT